MEATRLHQDAGHAERVQPADGAAVLREAQPALRLGRGQGQGAPTPGTHTGQRVWPTAAQVAQVDVVTVCETWWSTRAKQGVHVLCPDDTALAHAKGVAVLAGTNTVYAYRKLPT